MIQEFVSMRLKSRAKCAMWRSCDATSSRCFFESVLSLSNLSFAVVSIERLTELFSQTFS